MLKCLLISLHFKGSSLRPHGGYSIDQDKYEFRNGTTDRWDWFTGKGTSHLRVCCQTFTCATPTTSVSIQWCRAKLTKCTECCCSLIRASIAFHASDDRLHLHHCLGERHVPAFFHLQHTRSKSGIMVLGSFKLFGMDLRTSTVYVQNNIQFILLPITPTSF